MNSRFPIKTIRNFSLPQRAIDEFTWSSIQEVSEYCRENYAGISMVDVDVCIGGYQKWLAKNGFAIIDIKDPKNTLIK